MEECTFSTFPLTLEKAHRSRRSAMMASKGERRLHPRILINWPVVVRPPRDSSIEGETRDISVDGVFIQCSELFEFDKDFQIILKPTERRSILVSGEKVWSGNINIDGKQTYSGMGIRITKISPEDQQFISALVEKESEK
jgi:hypothetical protein